MELKELGENSIGGPHTSRLAPTAPETRPPRAVVAADTRGHLEDPTAMLHFSCDVCGKDMTPGAATRYVVKMEAFAATDPAELTDADLDADHVEEMAQLLAEMEETGCDEPQAAPARKTMRFDLCPCCYRKFIEDPLGREHAPKFDFSEN
jgi:hypothetical protein